VTGEPSDVIDGIHSSVPDISRGPSPLGNGVPRFTTLTNICERLGDTARDLDQFAGPAGTFGTNLAACRIRSRPSAGA
jgi:hypothetical protein